MNPSFNVCFRPQVSFDIRFLKAVQLMEVPLLRQWITQMVHDSLKLGSITLYFYCFQCYDISMIHDWHWSKALQQRRGQPK